MFVCGLNTAACSPCQLVTLQVRQFTFCLVCRDKTIMFDCGLHPGHHGMQSLPYFDDIDLAEVDLALITHFHMDHCAAVPYLACKTKFKVWCTYSPAGLTHAVMQDEMHR